jgi:hypothetical protein
MVRRKLAEAVDRGGLDREQKESVLRALFLQTPPAWISTDRN